MMLMEYIIQRPLYLVFILVNAWIVYKFIKQAISNNDDEEGDDDEGGGGITPTDPVLDLPPGVTLPRDEFEPVA